MPSRLTMKLSHSVALIPDDEAILAAIEAGGILVREDSDIIREGDRPENVHLVVDGLLCRYKLLPDGSRRIMALLIPGDFCDLHVAVRHFDEEGT